MRIRSIVARSAVAILLASTAITVIGCSTAGGPAMAPPPAVAPPPPPPPPPPAPSRPAVVGEEATSVDDVVVTGSRIRREGEAGAGDDARIAAPTPVALPDRGTRPAQPRPPQAGLLAAGHYDDLLDPTWVADYVGPYLQDQGGVSLPWVDTRQAITIAVSDAEGRPAPFVEVSVSRPQGEPLRLRTLADGTVVLFPGLDRLGRTADVTLGGAPPPPAGG